MAVSRKKKAPTKRKKPTAKKKKTTRKKVAKKKTRKKAPRRKTPAIRTVSGKFVKGVSGNPDGRPKKNRDLENMIQDLLERDDGTNVAVDLLMSTALNAAPKDSNAALTLLLAYGYGKPRQRVEIAGEGGGPLGITVTYVDAKR